MAQFIPKLNDPMMEIEIGSFRMTVNERWLSSISAKKRRHFWAVIRKKIKEEAKNGNTKKRGN